MMAAQSAGPEYTAWPAGSSSLGDMFIGSYRIYGDKTDLARGIQHLEELMSHDPSRRDIFLKLADAYTLRSYEGDLDLVFQCFKKVSKLDRRDPRETREADKYTLKMFAIGIDEWKRNAKRPFQNLISAHGWGVRALGKEDPECLRAFELMALVVLETAGIGKKLEDKYARLRGTQKSGAHAAAAAVKFARASLAVEWLELGLSATIRQIYQLRLDVGDLATRYPNLFEDLKGLSEELRQLSEDPVPTTGGLGALVGIITNFARHGPVILLSCDYSVTQMTHAFFILDPSSEEPIIVPLQEASPQEISILETRFSQLLDSLGIRHRSAEDDAENQLDRAGRVSAKKKHERTQVRVVVRRTMDRAECGGAPQKFLPIFLYMLLHLSIPHISRHTYGLEVLLNARARLGSTLKSSSTQLSVVGIGEYPHRPYLALPSVTREIQILSNLVEGNAGIVLNELEDNEARIDAVLSAIKSSCLVHLACHGAQDRQEPLNSHLVPADGNLQLRKTMMEDLKSAKFAFLSACQTATGESSLSNESVHLAGGFVAAGFKGVVGTLWRIADEDAPWVVKEVYGAMKIDGGLDIALAAEGLYRAVKSMRKSGVPAHRWVPFIHVGV
ncbi:hypothetical protein NP233_g7592 [Leucocoprinus birnbaumii]|uniref:CHAT domain-containing protein n=1 Tax=Leucocoprinus birnbaumii TaxID=56174 RepID=A0AAD5VP09_9AGAR|nr:hypothetical protein NP233_g7592 [Leucocoprinus birnbaumii]